MIARGFDSIGKGGEQMTSGGSDIDSNYRPTYTSKSSSGFDVDLTKYSKLSSYIEETMGGKYSELEITTDTTKFLSKFKGANKTTEKNKTKWHAEIDKKFGQYNTTLINAFSKFGSSKNGSADSTPSLQGTQAFEFARSIATSPGEDSKSDDYQLRQLLDRAARNIMKPYIYQTQLGPDKVGLLAVVPSLDNGVPQFTRGPTTVLDDAASVLEGFTAWMKEQDGIDKKKVTILTNKAKRTVRDSIVLTKDRIATLKKHTQAIVSLEAREIHTVVSVDGPDQVHKMQNIIAKKMLADISAYYKGATMVGRFKNFYDTLLAYSNSLTKSWFTASSKLVGKVTKQPLSDEFKFGKAWDGPRKKYLGVWSSPDENTWKGDDTGYNFSVAPILEARRALSSNLGIKSEYEQ